MDIINSSENYKTTSSCSGRIALLAEKHITSKQKWLFVSHDKIQVSVDSILQNYKISYTTPTEDYPLLYFKFEPFILHIEADTIQNAKDIFHVAYSRGYNPSGLIIQKKNIVQIRDTLKYVPFIVGFIVECNYSLILPFKFNLSNYHAPTILMWLLTLDWMCQLDTMMQKQKLFTLWLLKSIYCF